MLIIWFCLQYCYAINDMWLNLPLSPMNCFNLLQSEHTNESVKPKLWQLLLYTGATYDKNAIQDNIKRCCGVSHMMKRQILFVSFLPNKQRNTNKQKTITNILYTLTKNEWWWMMHVYDEQWGSTNKSLFGLFEKIKNPISFKHASSFFSAFFFIQSKKQKKLYGNLQIQTNDMSN